MKYCKAKHQQELLSALFNKGPTNRVLLALPPRNILFGIAPSGQIGQILSQTEQSSDKALPPKTNGVHSCLLTGREVSQRPLVVTFVSWFQISRVKQLHVLIEKLSLMRPVEQVSKTRLQDALHNLVWSQSWLPLLRVRGWTRALPRSLAAWITLEC